MEKTLKEKFADKGIEVRPINYGTMKALHSKGINLLALKDEQLMDTLVEVFDRNYPDKKEQAKLEGLSMPEMQDLFQATMEATNEAETKNS